MKLRFYLRGLGVGIVVTALILMLGNIFNKDDKEPEVLLDGQQTLAELNSEQLEKMSSEKEASTQEDKTSEAEDNKNDAIDNSEAEDNKNDADNNSEAAINEEDTSKEATAPEEAAAPETNATPKANASTEESVATQESIVTEENATSTINPEASENIDEYIIVTVNHGDGSYTVSSRVCAAGLCDDASSFDAFLMEKGYDKKLQAGNHELKKEMTWDEIGAELSRSVN